jgi:hypothetical protein
VQEEEVVVQVYVDDLQWAIVVANEDFRVVHTVVVRPVGEAVVAAVVEAVVEPVVEAAVVAAVVEVAVEVAVEVVEHVTFAERPGTAQIGRSTHLLRPGLTFLVEGQWGLVHRHPDRYQVVVVVVDGSLVAALPEAVEAVEAVEAALVRSARVHMHLHVDFPLLHGLHPSWFFLCLVTNLVVKGQDCS